MGELFRMEARAGQMLADMKLGDVRDGSVALWTSETGPDPSFALTFHFALQEGYDLSPVECVRLAEMLRAHATLAQRGMPWQLDEEPSGKPSKARWGGFGQEGGWLQGWTPWPPPDPPEVWLIGGETVVLSFADAVRLAQALEDAAGSSPGAATPGNG